MTVPAPVPSRSTRSCRFGPLIVEYDERVLAPREWTFMQSAWAAELATSAPPGPILELCAGAGHIGLAAAVLTDRDLVQVEMNPVAAGYAVGNAARAGRADRVVVRTHPMTAALGPADIFPLIIADPPYLPTTDVATWPDDPVSAIDGGADGLDLVRQCLDVGARHLHPDGRLLLQVAGPGQGEQVRSLLGQNPAPQLIIRELRSVDAARAVMLLTRPSGAR